ncbi:MAG TPA: hypothetical protein VK828_12395 [Terriglobales bacterium]|nr:hypothetical protein [Terriglobales bacterium]
MIEEKIEETHQKIEAGGHQDRDAFRKVITRRVKKSAEEYLNTKQARERNIAK